MTQIEQTFDAIVDPSGVATIEIQCSNGLRPWVVTQVSIELEGADGSVVCTLRKNGNLITPLFPAGDAAAGDPPVKLSPQDRMTVEWTGAEPGTQAKAYVLYDETSR